MDFGIFLMPAMLFAAVFGFAVATSDPNAISFEPIAVPVPLSDQGFNGHVVTELVAEELGAIQKGANTSRGSAYQSEEKNKAKTVEMVSDYLEFAKPLKMIQLSMGLVPFRLTGDVTYIGEDQLEVTLRGSASDGHKIMVEKHGPRSELKQVLHAAAVELMEKLDPYVVASYYMKIERKTKNFAETRRMIQYGLLHGTDEQLPWFYNLWGRSLYYEGHYEEAIDKYRRSLEVDPTFPRAYLHWGRALAAMNRNAEALEQYAMALRHDPTYGDAHVERGLSMAAMGRTADAMAEYEEALKIDPTHAYAMNKVGEMLLASGMTKAAIQKFRAAIALDPKDEGFKSSLDKALAMSDPMYRDLASAAKPAAAGGH